MQFRTYLIIVILVVVAFGIGAGWQNMRLRNAEKEWAAAKGEMQSQIRSLERSWTRSKLVNRYWKYPSPFFKLASIYRRRILAWQPKLWTSSKRSSANPKWP